MQIVFFNNFYKKNNSTKQPTVGSVSLTNRYTATGYLKEPCSILHPVVSLQNELSSNIGVGACTYAYIPRFGRYYFISDWTWDDGLWVAHMDVDVLASWKTSIGAETEYILRTDSSTTNFNGEITDMTYPATTDIITNTIAFSNIFSTDLTVGCYIVGIISGGSTQAVGAVSYYAMTSTEFGALKAKLFSNDNLEIMGIIDAQGQQLVQDLSQEVLKTLYNPYQYIVSSMWFPFGKSAITSSTAVSSIHIGWWDYPLTGNLLYAQTIALGNEGTAFTHHPQYARGTYLDHAPYTRRTIVGRFGSVAIDSAYFTYGNRINIDYLCDLITGQCLARFFISDSSGSTNQYLIAERNFLLGVPIQIAQVGTDYLGAAVQAIGTVGNAVTNGLTGFATGGIAGAVGGVIAGAANGIYNTLQAAMPQVETGGQNGSFLAAANDTHMVEQFYQIVDEDISHRGRPLCELRRIDTLTGFILCAEGDLDLDVYDWERSEIKKFLTTGFFWE